MNSPAANYPSHMRGEIEQTEHLRRVEENIGQIILSFCRDCLRLNLGVFQMNDLEDYVQRRRRVAPGSAGRILRALNNQGRLSYYCSDRATSTYVVRAIR